MHDGSSSWTCARLPLIYQYFTRIARAADDTSDTGPDIEVKMAPQLLRGGFRERPRRTPIDPDLRPPSHAHRKSAESAGGRTPHVARRNRSPSIRLGRDA